VIWSHDQTSQQSIVVFTPGTTRRVAIGITIDATEVSLRRRLS